MGIDLKQVDWQEWCLNFLAIVAQLVRALDCGSGGRGFEARRSPHFYHIHPKAG